MRTIPIPAAAVSLSGCDCGSSVLWTAIFSSLPSFEYSPGPLSISAYSPHAKLLFSTWTNLPPVDTLLQTPETCTILPILLPDYTLVAACLASKDYSKKIPQACWAIWQGLTRPPHLRGLFLPHVLPAPSTLLQSLQHIKPPGWSSCIRPSSSFSYVNYRCRAKDSKSNL